MTVQLTEAAAKKVKEFIDQDFDEKKRYLAYLRLNIFGGACSGYQYELKLGDTPIGSKDLVYESHGVKVVLNEKCLRFVSNTTVDYVDKLYGGGFVFNNPNATKSCGCGQSFDLKHDEDE